MATPQAVLSPSQDISPKTVVANPKDSSSKEYFPQEAGGSTTSAKTDDSIDSSDFKSDNFSDSTTGPVKASDAASAGGTNENKSDGLKRKSSVSIQLPRNPSLPQGKEKRINRPRLRNASPQPTRFQNRVAFDNVPLGEATKHNTPSFTLNVKHSGYRAGRRSRTFMVGVDEHAYSNYALQWLLDELVDDGDEVVCVRVIEGGVRGSDKQYQEDARNIMKDILLKNTANRALSFILEYAVGKLHGTFQKLIHMHQPAMLIVGTRGRSLGGIQGLVNTRNSFSKYCLQYSPVPVVVVRPTEKRVKKKEKRAADATRHTYASMLAATHGMHEADSTTTKTYDLEVQISPDEEAHQVAKVLGLPAAFDPTIKPLGLSNLRASHTPTATPLQSTSEAQPGEEQEAATPMSDNGDSSDSEEEGEGEFEVTSGQQALDQQKLEQLHKMEVLEAAALRMKVDEDDESEDESNSKSAS